jgi:hypothetical protein
MTITNTRSNDDDRDLLMLRLFDMAIRAPLNALAARKCRSNMPWFDYYRAAPLFDLGNVSCVPSDASEYGKSAIAWMSPVTLNWMMLNSNPADLRGRGVHLLGHSLSLKELNWLLSTENLPSIRVIDEGAMVDGAYRAFIQDGTVLIVPKSITSEVLILNVGA